MARLPLSLIPRSDEDPPLRNNRAAGQGSEDAHDEPVAEKDATGPPPATTEREGGPVAEEDEDTIVVTDVLAHSDGSAPSVHGSTIRELRAACVERGLSDKGKKVELLRRIVHDDEKKKAEDNDEGSPSETLNF